MKKAIYLWLNLGVRIRLFFLYFFFFFCPSSPFPQKLDIFQFNQKLRHCATVFLYSRLTVNGIKYIWELFRGLVCVKAWAKSYLKFFTETWLLQTRTINKSVDVTRWITSYWKQAKGLWMWRFSTQCTLKWSKFMLLLNQCDEWKKKGTGMMRSFKSTFSCAAIETRGFIRVGGSSLLLLGFNYVGMCIAL